MGLKVLITRGLKKVSILGGVLIDMGVIREGHFKGRLMKDEPQRARSMSVEGCLSQMKDY